jgi:hypothetical protein
MPSAQIARSGRLTVPGVSVNPFRLIPYTGSGVSVHPFRGFPYTSQMGVP